MPDPGKAVFLSYASQDAEAAKRIADALRASGVEVWFDQSELVGGDAWDAKIRKQIGSCALFVPVISAASQARAEGYFRLEWRLADKRTELMGKSKAFLLPICIDDTRDADADVPDSFTAVQWTRLRQGYGGQALDESSIAAFTQRVKNLLGGAEMEAGRPRPAERGEGAVAPRERGAAKWWWALPIFGVTMALLLVMKERRPDPAPAAVPPTVTTTLSPARQLVERARRLTLDKYDSTADDYATAEGLLKQALTLEQNDAEIWAFSSLFNTSIRTRGFDHGPTRRDQARRDAERALALAPDSIPALFALGRSQRDFDAVAAAKSFNRILQQNPDYAPALSNLAYIEDSFGHPAESAALYTRLMPLEPANEPLNRYLQFLLYFHYGRFAEAEQAVRRSVELKSSANSQGGLAMVLLTAKGDVEGAARALLTQSSRNEPRVIWMTALVQLCRRDPDAVLAALDRLTDEYIQDNWFSGPKAYFAGRAHVLAGRHEAARVAWESALAVVNARIKESPASDQLHIMRGQLLAFLGQSEEALREARTVEEIQRGGQAYWFRSPVLIYTALGRADAALPLLEKLVAFDRTQNAGWPLTRALLRIDPLWDPLRGDPRFQALCTEPAATAAANPDAKSVAVLAFANLSDDKANEYFSDGISEELLNVLAKVPELKVTARTSSFHFKGMKRASESRDFNLVFAEPVDLDLIASNPKTRFVLDMPELKELVEIRARNARAAKDGK